MFVELIDLFVTNGCITGTEDCVDPYKAYHPDSNKIWEQETFTACPELYLQF